MVGGNRERGRVLDGLGAAEIVTDITEAQAAGLILKKAGGPPDRRDQCMRRAALIVVYGNPRAGPR